MLLCISIAYSIPQWISISGDPEGTPPKITIIDDGTDEYTTLKVEIPGFYCEYVYESGQTFNKIWVPAYGTIMDIGKPELPVVRGLLGYPINKSADNIELESAIWVDFYDYLIYPSQPGFPMEGPKPPFEWDEEFYNQDIWYSEEEAIIAEPGMLRDVKVINTGVQSFRYNPFYRHLMVASEMIVRVNYGLAGGKGDGRFRQKGDDSSGVHPDTLPYYQSLIWNVNELSLHPTSVETDYLIITGDDYYDSVLNLSRLLAIRGYHFEIKTMSEISPEGDPLDVYHYIKEHFLNCSYVYVLLVGDVPDLLPDGIHFEPFDADTMVPIPYWLPWSNPSDVCYACIDNTDPPIGGTDNDWLNWYYNFDMYPDVFVGRLTADNIDQVNLMVDKIFEYEHPSDFKTDNSLNPWYDTMLFVACKLHHPPNDDWDFYGDKKRIKESLYHINLPTNIEIVCSDTGNLNYNNNYVMKYIESGCNIVNYWGHGAYLSWLEWTDIPDEPWGYKSFMYKPHVKNLNNDNLVVVFNMSCNTARIDIPYGDDVYKGESLCCRWLKENRGAVAAIGCTRTYIVNCNPLFALDHNLFYTMYGVPNEYTFMWKPNNNISCVHYGALLRTFVTNYDPYKQWSKVLALGGEYLFIIIGEPSLNIRNKWTEETKLSMKGPEKLIKETPMEITIYPNPSSGIFTLKYDGDPSELNNIYIYDISGRLVKEIDIPKENTETVKINDNTSEKDIQLDLKDLTDGIYIISVDKEVYKNILICR